VCAAAAIGLTASRAAISVGPAGSGVISFNARPSATDWSTKSISGTELSFLTAAELDAAVQTNSAASINAQVIDGGAGNPPGQNALASWSSGGTTGIWTRPAGNGATLLMATLSNDTGADQTRLRLIYNLTQSGSTPVEQISDHQVYYSLSGEPGSWMNIPALSSGGIGTKSNTVSLNGTWASAAALYVLWVDDNAVGGVDRGYSLDDVFFACNTTPALAAIPDFIADVGRPVAFFAAGSDADTPPAQLLYSFELGPPTARINSSNGLLRFVPLDSGPQRRRNNTIHCHSRHGQWRASSQRDAHVQRHGQRLRGGQRRFRCRGHRPEHERAARMRGDCGVDQPRVHRGAAC